MSDVKFDRCVVISPRHEFIRPWIRAYFANGNTTPLVIVPGPEGDWRDDDIGYCESAAKFSGGIVFDCSKEWEHGKSLAGRAIVKNVGWYTKKLILHAVATKLSPKSWAWIDDDVEITGNVDECFEYAEGAPGFICAQFYYPNEIDNTHPSSLYRPKEDSGDKICWNSFVFFHGDANERIAEELCKEYNIEDDEIIFGDLYKSSDIWHDGFCDFSTRNWQKTCKTSKSMPKSWSGKAIHYTSGRDGGEMKLYWALKGDVMPKAPFERETGDSDGVACEEDAVDAVFVIGTGSVDNNEELRYALRNLERNCKFVRDVYVCGFCPQWVDKSVVKHLNWPDRFSHAKDANIIDKLRHACEHEGIAKKILFCSDDQFQTHPCEWDDFYPRYLRKFEKGDSWYDDKRRVWHTRLKKTLLRDVERRKACGMDEKHVFYYQPHMWMQIDRDKFVNYARWCNYERRDDTIIASGYFNFIDADGEPDSDHVFLGSGATKLPDATHIAYHDGSYKAAIGILRKMFPEKSRFEIGYGKIEGKGNHIGEPEQKIRVTGLVGGRAGDFDPSKASKEEIDEILEVSSMIRDNPVWNGLLSEMSRAEELRLFGVMGWRLVWRDLISRWRDETKNGSVLVPVSHERSEDASGIVNAYMSDPDSMRTIKFGGTVANHSRSVPSFGRQMPRTPPEPMMSALRNKIRTALRKWHK